MIPISLTRFNVKFELVTICVTLFNIEITRNFFEDLLAINSLPFSILIPCHRIIRKDGSLGEYAWGRKMKRVLLDIEVSGMADSIYRGGK